MSESKPHPNDSIPIDKLVNVFLKMRNAHNARQSQDKKDAMERKAQMRKIENEMLRRANATGVEGYTTKAGTVYPGEDWHASIADEAKFRRFLENEEDPYGWFTNRIRLERVREWMKDAADLAEASEGVEDEMGGVIPGLNLFREKRMKVREKTSPRARKPKPEERDEDEYSSDD